MATLTRAQRDAVARAKKFGHIWPTGRGRFAVSGTNGAEASDITVRRLVDLEILTLSPQYRAGAGVMPYYVLNDIEGRRDRLSADEVETNEVADEIDLLDEVISVKPYDRGW